MTNRFTISVAAAALIAGTGFAYAQGTGTNREAPAAGSNIQQTAPSSAGQTKGEAAEQSRPSPGMKATQSEQKSPGASKSQRAEDNMQGPKSKSMSSENDKNSKGGQEMKAEGREDKNGMKAEGREDKNGSMKAEGSEGRSGNMNAEQKNATDNRSQTTGQAGAGAKLSGEQRTKITTVIREQHVAPVTNVNFSITVGTRVPHEMSFHPLPAEVVTIYPEWRGYEFILVRDQIVVIDPRTFEIVAVIEA
jgi:hypothetical protein